MFEMEFYGRALSGNECISHFEFCGVTGERRG